MINDMPLNEKAKTGRNSKFASEGWIFDQLFTKKRVDPNAQYAQKWRDDDPDYKEVSDASLKW
jgi:hypothetical protein